MTPAGAQAPRVAAQSEGTKTETRDRVGAEVAALKRMGQNSSGPDVSKKQPNSVLFRQAEKISTAKSHQATTPRDLWEQTLWNRVVENPAAGKPLASLAKDDRFPHSDGFMKMEASHRLPDGSSITIHYQYNSVTKKAYDIKIVTKQASALQPGPSIK
jgi:filamentous hemagglutinin